jgi:hypothetical protein
MRSTLGPQVGFAPAGGAEQVAVVRGPFEFRVLLSSGSTELSKDLHR